MSGKRTDGAAYSQVVGGKLNLKRGTAALPTAGDVGHKKKKHRTRKPAGEDADAPVLNAADLDAAQEADRKAEGLAARKQEEAEAAAKAAEEAKDPDSDLARVSKLLLTPAQLAFERTRQQTMSQTMKQTVSKSHREKVEEFNEKLAKLPVHFDIPKVASAGNG